MLYQCIIIGAGASGLFFAATRKNPGPVLLLDNQARPGRKLLLSGGGKCNVTNLGLSPANYIGANPQFCRAALAAFTPRHMLDFLQRHRIALEERDYGQMFCKRGAEELRDLLLELARRNGADLHLGQRICTIRYLAPNAPAPQTRSTGLQVEACPSLPQQAAFQIITDNQEYLGRNLLIATGGPAWPKAGASTFGQSLAAALGHSIVPPAPALTPLKMPPEWPLHGLQGLNLTATLTLHTNGTPKPGAPAFTLPLLFTHSGLSGPACLQISSYLEPGDDLCINFLPGQNFTDLLDAPTNARLTPLHPLRKLLPPRLAAALLPPDLRERKCAEISRAHRNLLHAAVHAHRVTPVAPTFAQAESSRGGINTTQISPTTMQSLILPHLYITGEAMDVCGQLGGYNLHWAWASAWCAGRVV